MTRPILCAGRLYCDLVFMGVPRLPTLGTEVFAGGLSLHAGGGAFITAATLAALNQSSSLCAVLPSAPFEAVVRDDIDRHEVKTCCTRSAAAGTDPQITVAMSGPDDRAFLTRADGPALPDLAGIDFAAFRHLHIGELATLQDTPELIDAARSNGLTISLDCGWQDSFDAAARDLIAQVDVFLPNAPEAEALSGTSAALTVIKCGADGAKARARAEADWLTAQAAPREVCDPTGAGDAFNGGFLAAWLNGRSLPDCLAQGNLCGGLTVEAVGGTGGIAAIRDLARIG